MDSAGYPVRMYEQRQDAYTLIQQAGGKLEIQADRIDVQIHPGLAEEVRQLLRRVISPGIAVAINGNCVSLWEP